MSATAIKPITKDELAELVINEYGLDSDWSPTDEEVALAIKTQQLKSNSSCVPEGSMSYEDVVSELFRVDTKTKRLMQSGFIIFDGEAYFAEEADAVEYLNANGFECTHFAVSEDGELDETYFTDWCEWY